MNKKAFTLTEILIVIVIGIILVALIAPRALRAIAQANYLNDQSNIKTINEALVMCWTDTRNWSSCGSDTQLTANGKYLKSFPVHPCGGTYTIADVSKTDGEDGKEVSNPNPCPKPK